MSDKWYPGKNLGFKKKSSKAEPDISSKPNSKYLSEDYRQMSEDKVIGNDNNGDLMMSIRRGKM